MAFGSGSRKSDGSWAPGKKNKNTTQRNNINPCICRGGMRKWLDKETVKEAELLTRVSPTTSAQLLLITLAQLISQIPYHMAYFYFLPHGRRRLLFHPASCEGRKRERGASAVASLKNCARRRLNPPDASFVVRLCRGGISFTFP